MSTRAPHDLIDSYYWQTLRKKVKKRDGYACTLCGDTEELHVDHIIERADWPKGEPGLNDMDNLRTLCGPHHRAKSAMTHSERSRNGHRIKITSSTPVGPHPSPPTSSALSVEHSTDIRRDPDDLDRLPTFDPRDPAWSEAPWIRGILDERPGNATFPRLMSGPHPKAVGTLLPELEAWLPTFGVELRWWQRLALARVLEVDESGDLVWWQVLLSTSRQSGKSTLLRILLMFMVQQEDRWHDIRDALFISKDVLAAKEILRPAQLWVKRNSPPDWSIKEANGELDVTYRGNRWMVRSKDSAYGYSAAVVVADEAWKLAPQIVEEGIEPLLVERRNSQLVLVSTAHRMASSLIRNRRDRAIADIPAPDRSLIVEWSAPHDAELTDPGAWRAASPHWSDRREALIAARVVDALDGRGGDPDEPDPRQFVLAQWLNVWPEAPAPPAVGVPLLDDEVWAGLRSPGLHIPEGGLIASMEAGVGHVGVAVAWRDEAGATCILGQSMPSMESAWSWLGSLPPGTEYVVGLSWRDNTRAQDLGAVGMGQRETEPAMRLVADLVEAGSLRWDGDELDTQVTALRVVDSPSTAGKALVRSATPTHIARAAFWAVYRLDQAPAGSVIW